ncbi:hypothetical protein [Reichenbachiella ulvae]|uniref:Glycosyl hydrolases family 28 n=1 Tax=Reichenbachiella ulvae TaxID=2980104 RepID=A0ABT3D021_9BACT|nr:hypothetical protein [Reichenbachiella ulvae]MCV9389307.1 hypothetical protein [Reichenbachiella ulvae]
MKRIVLYIAMLYLVGQARAQLVTYPPAENITRENPNIYPSEQYIVTLEQDDRVIQDFVYCMSSMHTTNYSETTSWVNFSFEGKVKVTVECLQSKIDFAQIQPLNKEVEPAILSAGKIEFLITEPGQYSVEFEQGSIIKHPLLIFANPLEEMVPDKSDEHVVYFGPGFHKIGDRLELKSGQHLYLAGGAYVKGQIYAEDVENVKISGRGIISGEDYMPRTHEHMIRMRNANQLKVEGITMIHSPRYMIAINGDDHYFNNIKMMGWWFSTDGISAGTNTLIENCFFKVNDDAIKLYKSNTTVRKCVIWQMENGAPFMISWNGRSDFGDCHVYDIDVIRVEHHWDNENLAVFCAVHGGQADISNFLIEDIRIYNSKWRMFHLVTRPNRWGKWNPDKGSLSDFHFKNITYFGSQQIPSLIMGHDEYHPIHDIQFENIMIDGQVVQSFKRDQFIVDEEFTQNISIK